VRMLSNGTNQQGDDPLTRTFYAYIILVIAYIVKGPRMTADRTASGEPPASRSERLTRDVLHALMIDSQPWAEIQANRREIVRTTFEELDPQDEFEGMLASQMAVAHSIFLGTTWLSLDRERPERDRTHYLRQATRLMMLYRQSFNTLRQWRRERQSSAYGSRRHLAFTRKVEGRAGTESGRKSEQTSSGLPSNGACLHCAVRDSLDKKALPPIPTVLARESPPRDFSLLHDRRHRLMATTGLAFAQGP
jgi:hypothetical protein